MIYNIELCDVKDNEILNVQDITEKEKFSKNKKRKSTIIDNLENADQDVFSDSEEEEQEQEELIANN